MLELTEDGRWPEFVAPSPVPAYVEDGYGHLACFVSAEAIRELGAEFASGLRSTVGPGPRDEQDRAIAGRLHEQLRRLGIPFTREPWHPGQGQVIRDPGSLVRRGASGTCIDLALLYAGLALGEDLSVALLLQGGSAGSGSGHVMVVVQLGVGALEDSVPGGCDPCGPGVQRVVDQGRLVADPEVLVLDVTRATRPDSASFDEALAAGAQHLTRAAEAHLVLVGPRQARFGDLPLPSPRRASALLSRLPGLPALDEFPTQERVLKHLKEARGVVVLRGPSGTGKSTLALRAAGRIDRGRGWLLPATDAAAVTSALAGYWSAERGDTLDALDKPDIDGLATAARVTLAAAAEPWVVVLDNADQGPHGLEPVLRLATENHLVLVTSTAPAEVWAPHGTVMEVPTLADEEVAAQIPDPDLRAAAGGTLVLVTAFRQLLNEVPVLPSADRALTGAALYADLLARSVAADKIAGQLLEVLGWLPPDRTDITALAGPFGAEVEAGADILARHGLLTAHGEGLFSVHRLLAAALRARVPAVRAPGLIVDLFAEAEVRELLLRCGDREVARNALSALGSDPGGVPGVGTALSAIAAVQELHEPKASHETYALAEKLLSPERPEQRALLADALHDLARVVNQMGDPSLEQIASARAQVARAKQLRAPADLVGRAKHEALEALLRQRAARHLSRGSVERQQELREVLAELRRSYDNRLAALGPEHPLVDRAYFNLAGVQLSLAQELREYRPTRLDLFGVTESHVELAARLREEAGALLDAAHEIYERTEAFRIRFYGDHDNPLRAASVAGIATAQYLRAVLGLGSDPYAALDDALRHALEAFNSRLAIADASRNGDVVKSSRLLSKISAAWAVAAAPAEKNPWTALRGEIDREIAWHLRPEA